MGRYDEAVFFPVKCQENGKLFFARYDFAADDRWVLTYGIPENEMSSAQHINNRSLRTVDVENSRLGPQYRCPYCGNDAYVRCGKCGKLTCNSSDYFTCAYCGNSGTVSGQIKSQEGESGRAQ